MAYWLALAVGAFLLLLAGLLLRRGVFLARLIRALSVLRPRTVGQLEPGLAMARGKIQGDPLLKSPFQNRDCVYYFFQVLEPRADGKHRILAKGKEWTLARLEDETGSASVEAVTAMVASPRRFETSLRGLSKVPPDLADFFERAGIDAKHLPRLPHLRIHEYTLEPGDDVFVTGTVRATPEGKLFYRKGRGPLIVSSDSDVGYARALRNELLIYLATPPLLATAGLVLVALAFA